MIQLLLETVQRFLKKLEIKPPYDLAIPLLGIYPKETKTVKDTCTPMFIAALFTIARTWKQPRCPSTDEWIKKLWCTYTMEYYSAIKRSRLESVLMRGMNLEPTMRSEVSQKEKENAKYCLLMHIHGIWKDGTDEITYREAMETQTQGTDFWLWRGGAEEEGEVYGKSHTETHMTKCKMTASGNSLYDPGDSNRASATAWRGAMGREMGASFKREGALPFKNEPICTL